MRKTDPFGGYFFHQGKSGLSAYEEAVRLTKEMLMAEVATHLTPYSGKTPLELEKASQNLMLVSQKGEAINDVLSDLQETILHHTVRVSHPKNIAHLHCPPLIASLAAEMMISVLNQSMDSWDQSPSATYAEVEMVRWFCRKFGYSLASDGIFTSGGTQSNYMGLLLARDHFCQTQFKWDVQTKGLPREAHRMRILCSENAHFTVRQSAAQLGLGEEAVIPVKTDEDFRLCLKDLDKKLNQLFEEGLFPFAIVATCGTTDFGSIDPIARIAERAKKNQLWLHVDAAYGGALILSDRHRFKLHGIGEADSIAVDFHKLFYQPISCGAFLLKEGSHLQLITLHADYLNPKVDEWEGIVNLVGKSTQTTRRFDALKILASLRIVGVENFGKMIDHTIDLANEVANLIKGIPDFEVITGTPELNAVVFRYITGMGDVDKENQLNREIQQSLLQQGSAVIAKTSVHGKTCLKFTLLNPRTKLSDVEEVLQEISLLGKKLTVNKSDIAG
ncbi:pyridoxal phosphate-dependent decarboxylase family protein [Salinithrix halophila]|uniref:Pyridoxal phosphate-dependent decarboxylase family protein n=1 Tax=Salinithrix halophila TaxID=1485204 RepID=A0ABV8JFI5_9BACL